MQVGCRGSPCIYIYNIYIYIYIYLKILDAKPGSGADEAQSLVCSPWRIVAHLRPQYRLRDVMTGAAAKNLYSLYTLIEYIYIYIFSKYHELYRNTDNESCAHARPAAARLPGRLPPTQVNLQYMQDQLSKSYAKASRPQIRLQSKSACFWPWCRGRRVRARTR